MEKVKSVRLELPNGEFSDAMPFAVDGSNIEIDDKTLGELLNNKVNKNGDEMTGNLTVSSLTVGTRMTDSTVGQNSFAQGTAVNASGIDSHGEGYNTTASKIGSHAEGQYTEAQEEASHAEGYHSIASGKHSHAEGNYTRASKQGAHAEGINTKASGNSSHAEGNQTIASGSDSHAEGFASVALGQYSHAEGQNTTAQGTQSHAEGINTWAKGKSQHVQGRNNIIDNSDKYAHIVGNGTAENARSNAHTLTWNGTAWFQGDVYVGSENGIDRDAGSKKLATEDYITNYLDQKQDKLTAGANITIENNVINAVIDSGDTDIRNYENLLNRPAINGVILSGDQTGNTLGLVSKTGDTMTGPLTTTVLTVGTRLGATAGANSATVGNSGAIGTGAFSQGYNCEADGDHSHAEGYQTIASGDFSHAEGRETQTYGGAQHVEGIYNIVDTSANTPTGNNYVHIVGNGNNATRSNAYTLDWQGNAWFSGDVYVGSISGTNKDAGSYKLESQKNKIMTITENVTDEQYPSAKAVYNAIPTKTSELINDNKFITDFRGAIKVINTLTDVNTLTDTGVYAICFTHNSDNSHLPISSWGILYTYNKDVTGTAFQMYIPDGAVDTIYKRTFSLTDGSFGDWIQITENVTKARTPISHASTSTTYGIGTTANYGHVKTINNLTTNSYTDGNALSAYQGYLLNQNKENLSNKITSISAASTDTQYASAKAIYNFVPNITYGETDLSSSASLAAGAIYLVYE